jgi:carbamoyl-phosphate synthase large subunit
MKKIKKNILIAGIGGASLGTEIFKSLKLSKKYRIFGTDISPYAFGLYQEGFVKTYLIKRENYIYDLLTVCRKEKIDAIIPGGVEPLLLLYKNQEKFKKDNIFLAINSPEVIKLCTDKIKTFDYLEKKGIPVPVTKIVSSPTDLKSISYPCIIKPSMASGGSVFVHIAEDYGEAALYVSFLKKRGIKTIVQKYISADEGEYTVGVLSLPTGEVVGSIALKRFFNAKLSVLMKINNRVISSGYSQGIIDNFGEIRKQAEAIAKAVNSKGPLNIQGRLKNGIFYPFEINPRFSATTYLRAMAGFNEIDMFLDFLFTNKKPILPKIKYGYYCRSLKEQFVSFKKIKI